MPFFVVIAALMAVANASEQYQNNATELYLAKLNESLANNFLWSLLGLAAVALAYRTTCRTCAHMRHLSSLTNGGTQRYFTIASPTMAWLKDHILYAPLFHHRRATEIKFSKNFNLGSVPTRFQAIFITAVSAVNILSCVYNIPWSDPVLQVLPILRNRTGTLSVGNLIPILMLATIKNPLISVLDISYDSFNLMHRWFGRLSILQGIAHTLCYIIGKVKKSDWEGVGESIHKPAIYTGLVATIGFTMLFLQGPKLVRSWAYEVFLHIHFVVVVVTLAFLWLHLKQMRAMPQLYMLIGAIATWAAARLWRLLTLLHRSWGKQRSNVAVEAMPGDALRISVTCARPWTFRPGQSIYLTIPAIGWWTAHPFSVAWSDVDEPLSRSTSVRFAFKEKKPADAGGKISEEKEPASNTCQLEVERDRKPTYSLIVKAKSGMTKTLLEHVKRRSNAKGVPISFNALIEGPYGGERSLASYGNVMLFASGVGITHHLPYVRELLEGHAAGTVAARKVTLIWVIPYTDYLEWIRPWMHEVLGMPNRREVLKVMLYVTRAGLSQPIRSPSETVRMLRGRPDVETIMNKEASEKIGCMGISVCSGGGLADEVRRVSRMLCAKGVNLDYMEESFGW